METNMVSQDYPAMTRVLVIIGCILIAGIICDGATATYDGKEKDFWATHTLVVAKVLGDKSLAASQPTTQPSQIKLSILAVMATEQLIPTELSVSYRAGVKSPLREFNPAENEVFILCLDRTKDGWHISSDYLSFMPAGSAAKQIEGLDDKEVANLSAAVQKLIHEAK